MTIGKVATDLLYKSPDTRDPIELERAMQEDYLKYLLECVEIHKKHFPANFFVVILTKNERLLPNVFRNFFSARSSCPTPNYDQTVFAFNKKEDRIEYIWTIPSRDACHHLLANKNEVVAEERQLLNFILQFEDGTLYKLARRYNGEDE